MNLNGFVLISIPAGWTGRYLYGRLEQCEGDEYKLHEPQNLLTIPNGFTCTQGATEGLKSGCTVSSAKKGTFRKIHRLHIYECEDTKPELWK
jgi:hypothetical protein